MERSRNSDNSLMKRRVTVLAMLLVASFVLYSVRLFQVQIVDGADYAAKASKEGSISVDIPAARGEILDRYLRPMAVNRTSFSIVLDKAFFPSGSSEEQQKKQNDILLSLTDMLAAEDSTWNDSLPLTRQQPYAFLEEQETAVAKMKKLIKKSDYATADQCMAQLIARYELEGYTAEQQRTLAGVRYEMEIRQFTVKNPFTLSTNVTESVYNRLLENSASFPGVTVETVPVREYVSGSVAPHLMGSVGPIYAEEYQELKSKGYRMNDTVGKGGIEGALESVLRGTRGVSSVIKDSTGAVVDKVITEQPVPGSSVVLTLDYNLEKAAQDILDEKVKELRSQGGSYGNGQDVKSGAVVMLDVKSNGVLVSASWPTYDLTTYNKNYETLVNDPDKPLFNRALNGAFPCGSTMKPGVALAGLTEGLITRDSRPVTCTGRYTYYSNLTLKCLGVHGAVNVVDAIAKSCNVFFYDLGRRLGIQKLDEYATLYGLGQKTGIELGESEGTLAAPKSGETWYPIRTSQAAIGQDTNRFTPIQLAAYASMIANGGVRYKTHLVKSVRSYDGVETPVQPEVAATVKWTQEAMDAVKEGMVKVITSGTARSAFAGVTYTVAGKTGTAQTGVDNTSDHGVFIAYAPADDPQVAIAVVLENGTSKPAAQVARKVLDAYFSHQATGESVTPEGELLP